MSRTTRGQDHGLDQQHSPDQGAFTDLLTANRAWAATEDVSGFDGIARAGVALLTCMDSRIEPLQMIGLQRGDAKILRTPGGHLTPDALTGCVLAVHLLQVRRILVVCHTRCAVASGTEEELRAEVAQSAGVDVGDLVTGADPDQLGRLSADLAQLRSHPLLTDRVRDGRVQLGGFRYDVDTGYLQQLV